MVSHIHPGSHSSAPTTELHKILHPTPKGEHQSLAPNALLILLIPWNETWNLRIYFGINKDLMREAD